MKYKHICFDFDGVLINSLLTMNESWNICQKKFKLVNNFDEYKELIGLPFFKILEHMQISKNLWHEIKTTYDEISEIEIDKVEIYEDIYKLLDYLDENKLSYSIFTSKTKKRTMSILKKKFNKYEFLNIVSPEDLPKGRGKPYGDGINLLIDFYNLEKKSFLFIGDSYFDYKASVDADVDFVFAKWGYGVNQNYPNVSESVLDLISYIETSKV